MLTLEQIAFEAYDAFVAETLNIQSNPSAPKIPDPGEDPPLPWIKFLPSDGTFPLKLSFIDLTEEEKTPWVEATRAMLNSPYSHSALLFFNNFFDATIEEGNSENFPEILPGDNVFLKVWQGASFRKSWAHLGSWPWQKSFIAAYGQIRKHWETGKEW